MRRQGIAFYARKRSCNIKPVSLNMKIMRKYCIQAARAAANPAAPPPAPSPPLMSKTISGCKPSTEWHDFDVRNYLMSHWHPGAPHGLSCAALSRLGNDGDGGKYVCDANGVRGCAPDLFLWILNHAPACACYRLRSCLFTYIRSSLSHTIARLIVIVCPPTAAQRSCAPATSASCSQSAAMASRRSSSQCTRSTLGAS